MRTRRAMPVLKRFFDIAFSTGSVDDISTMMVQAARAPMTSMLVTPNVDHIVALDRKLSAEEKAVYASADIFVCDSKIIGRLARLHDIDLTPRTGTDRTYDVLNSPGDSDLVFALAGPTQEQTELMRQRYPQHRFVHIETPYGLKRGSDAWNACVAEAAAAEWQVLLSCISFPRQELLAYDIRTQRQGGGLIMCVGSAVDFLSGTHKRAPMAFQRFGMEWLHRLLTNPRRLWRRYLVEGPNIFILYLKRRMRGQL